MQAGYTVEYFDLFGDDKDSIVQMNYKVTNLVKSYGFKGDTEMIADDCTVAIFRLRPKVHCDSCNDLDKCKVDDYGDMICQKCQDNRDEEEGTRFLNDKNH